MCKKPIFNLSKGKLGVEAMPAFGKFLVAMLQGLALRCESMPEFARVPTHLIIDECHNFITPAIEEILKESRKYAMHLTLAQQTIGDKMSSELQYGNDQHRGKDHRFQRQEVPRYV